MLKYFLFKERQHGRDIFLERKRTAKPATSESKCAASVSTASEWARYPPTTSTSIKHKHKSVAFTNLDCADAVAVDMMMTTKRSKVGINLDMATWQVEKGRHSTRIKGL